MFDLKINKTELRVLVAALDYYLEHAQWGCEGNDPAHEEIATTLMLDLVQKAEGDNAANAAKDECHG